MASKAQQIIEILSSIQLDFEERQLANDLSNELALMDPELVGHLIVAAKYLDLGGENDE